MQRHFHHPGSSARAVCRILDRGVTFVLDIIGSLY
jgi:hypothetical protein